MDRDTCVKKAESFCKENESPYNINGDNFSDKAGDFDDLKSFIIDTAESGKRYKITASNRKSMTLSISDDDKKSESVVGELTRLANHMMHHISKQNEHNLATNKVMLELMAKSQDTISEQSAEIISLAVANAERKPGVIESLGADNVKDLITNLTVALAAGKGGVASSVMASMKKELTELAKHPEAKKKLKKDFEEILELFAENEEEEDN